MENLKIPEGFEAVFCSVHNNKMIGLVPIGTTTEARFPCKCCVTDKRVYFSQGLTKNQLNSQLNNKGYSLIEKILILDISDSEKADLIKKVVNA